MIIAFVSEQCIVQELRIRQVQDSHPEGKSDHALGSDHGLGRHDHRFKQSRLRERAELLSHFHISRLLLRVIAYLGLYSFGGKRMSLRLHISALS